MMQRGRLGTRNAMVLALDCFHPQWDPKHLWLTPITRAVQIGMVRNAPYADHVLRMSPTLSPANLAPQPGAFDQAIEWGRASIEPVMPFVNKMLEPVWWVGDGPPAQQDRRAPVSLAPAVGPILAAAADRSRAAVRRLRDRYLT